MEDKEDTEESTDEEDDKEDKNEVDQEFEDEVEAMLQGAEAGDMSDEDENLPESSGGGYVVAVYEGQWLWQGIKRMLRVVLDWSTWSSRGRTPSPSPTSLTS
jgi:hypothetical protein